MSITAGLREFKLPLSRAGRDVPSAVDELLLLREMNHRFANTLTLLVSQFRGDPESSESPQFRDLIARTEARIVAFGNLHRSLMVGAANTCISVQGTQVVGVLAVQTETAMGARMPEPRMTPQELVSDALDAVVAGTNDEIVAGAQSRQVYQLSSRIPKRFRQ